MSSFPLSIGNQIKRIRKEKKMTQKELCDGICSQAEISKIENGRNSPTIDLLQEIAKRLRVPMSLLFQDRFESEAYREIDNLLSRLLREQKYEFLQLELEKIKISDTKAIYLLKSYFKILLLFKTNRIDYRSASSLLINLTNEEDVWYEAPQIFIRIKMAISNLYTENGKFHLAEKVYLELESLEYDTKDLKRHLLKIYYNHAQLLTFHKKYEEGMVLTKKGLQDSLKLNDSSFVAHFYYQRGYYNEILENITLAKQDYTIAYTLFHTLQLETYKEIVYRGKKIFLLFSFDEL
ncbi:helix-turn-helix domain-containing protein [Exiguobacterium sp. s193]|uniref:helix-turn-helix domain-containing protein n=1 Tax=Exiguobacterium sp. s193 TaxID=2751207 RepID=UPI0025571101|nr:helix-turn-helix domain-containing protein [Exiguobacterium sp. s193]